MYKNCIWVKSQSVESIGYQDSPFELRTAFEVTRDCRALDFPQVLCFELCLPFKSFYKFHSFQNQVLHYSLSLYTNCGSILWPCAYFFNPHKPNMNSSGVSIIYLKALAHRFVSSIIIERLDESFLCGVIFRPTYAASTSTRLEISHDMARHVTSHAVID